MNAVATRAAKRLQKWPVQELVNTAWSFAKLALWHSPFWQAVTRVAREPWPRFVAQDLSTLAWAFAAVRCGSSALAALGRALLHADAAPQHLALMAWAFAVVAFRDEPLLEAVAAEAIAQVAAFGSGPAAPCQDLALMFWAFATLGMCHIPLLDALSAASERKLPQFNPQNLANTAWSLAALQVLLPPLMHAIGGRAVELFDEFGPQEVANTAWAFAKVSVFDRALFHALALAALENSCRLNPQEISNIVWSYAVVMICDDPLFEALSYSILRSVDQFDSQNLSNTFWAFAVVFLSFPEMMSALCKQASGLVQQFAMQELANTAWAFATMSEPNQLLVKVIAEQAADMLAQQAEFKMPASHAAARLFLVNVCALAWSFTLMQLDRFLPGAEAAVRRLGARFGLQAEATPTSGSVAGLASAELKIEMMSGMCLVMKPPGWEVDSEGCSGLRPLSGFLQARLPAEHCQLLGLTDFGRGFVHRLDTPSSGLVLVATSFQGYCCLEWQMYTYQIAREYVVLGHGSLPSTDLHTTTRILDSVPCAVCSARGRPAESRLKLIANAGHVEAMGMVAISIRTGRRHQIRVHLQHSGCPSVADHKYGLTSGIYVRQPDDRQLYETFC